MMLGESVNIMWFALFPLAFFVFMHVAEITYTDKKEELFYDKLFRRSIYLYIIGICCIPFWILWMEGVI